MFQFPPTNSVSIMCQWIQLVFEISIEMDILLHPILWSVVVLHYVIFFFVLLSTNKSWNKKAIP